MLGVGRVRRTARISNSSMFTLAALQSHYTGPSHLPWHVYRWCSRDIYMRNRNFIVLSVCLPGGHVVRPWEKRMNYGSEGFVSALRKMDRGRESNREKYPTSLKSDEGETVSQVSCVSPLWLWLRFVIAPGVLRPWSFGICSARSFLHNYPLLWSLSHPMPSAFIMIPVSKRVYGELCGVD